MPINKTEFDAALALDQEVADANAVVDTKTQEAKDARQALRQLIATWSLFPPGPNAVALVEHEGTVYRVNEGNIVALVPESTV
jgi:hypothetical protein